MEMNPVEKEVTGYYTLSAGTFEIGTLDNLPDEFFSFDQAGLDPTVKTRSMGGIFASNRNSNVDQTFAFHSFNVLEYPLPPPDPIDAILHYMESQNLTRRDLELYLGSRARVSEILNRKRPLSLTMIRKLHSGLGIPAEILISNYALQAA